MKKLRYIFAVALLAGLSLQAGAQVTRKPTEPRKTKQRLA